ncbi:MAG: PDZ domain-containing protein [Gammaproteobacteria bacterium]|nr:PDZ domain-containing protein [Gammaproteobacteria bacterium]
MTIFSRFSLYLALAFFAVAGAGAQENRNQDEQDYKEVREQLDRAVEALAELESDVIVHELGPLVHSLQPGVESLTEMLLSVLSEFDEAIQLGQIGVTLSTTADKNLTVVGIQDWSPAIGAGLQQDDQVVTIDGLKIAEADDPEITANRLISSLSRGDTLRLGVLRDGKQVDIPIEVGTSSAGRTWFVPSPNRSYVYMGDGNYQVIRPHDAFSGWLRPNARGELSEAIDVISLLEVEEELGHYFGVDFGVLVLSVSDKHEVLKPGDVLMKIGNNSVRSYSHANRYLRQRSDTPEMEITVRRRGKQTTVDLDSSRTAFVSVLER